VPTTACGQATEPVFLTDDNNYILGWMQHAEFIATENGVDLAFDWCSLSQDMQGAALASDALDTAVLIRWDLDLTEVREQMAELSLDPTSIAAQTSRDVGSDCSVTMSSFDAVSSSGSPGVPLPTDGTYQLSLLASGIEASTILFSASADSTVTQLLVHNESASVEPDPVLTSGLATPAPSSVIDWSSLTAAAWGAEFPLNKYDSLTLSRYSSGPADLADSVGDLEAVAIESRRYNIDSLLELDISEVPPTDSSEPTTTFDADFTWLLSLDCSTCTSGFPPFITVLDQ